MGIPATGASIACDAMTIFRIANGKIAEEVGLDDGVTALQQLGLIKLAA